MSLIRKRHALFNRLIKPHFQLLHRTDFHLTRNPTEAEDLLQEVFIKLYRKIDDIEAVTPLEPWLSTVLHNTFIDIYRKKSKLNSREISTTEFGVTGYDRAIGLVSVAAPNEENRFSNRQSLDRGLLSLSPEHRAVIVLHDVIGYTIDEMQTIVNVPAGTIKSRIHRARQLLRHALSNETNSVKDSL